MQKRPRKVKHGPVILLEGINARDVYNKHKKRTVPPVTTYVDNVSFLESTPVTNIVDLKGPSDPVFLDSVVKDTKSVTMIDYINYGCLPERTDLCCWHCHHLFHTSPIGAPIKYVKRALDRDVTRDLVITGTNDYFLTHGIFCSFPCCLAFVDSKGHKGLFRNSKTLLYSLYYKLYQREMDVRKAPSWETLKEYGGDLSIEEFRESFCTAVYTITENIKRPIMVAVGRFVEEKRCGLL